MQFIFSHFILEREVNFMFTIYFSKIGIDILLAIDQRSTFPVSSTFEIEFKCI